MSHVSQLRRSLMLGVAVLAASAAVLALHGAPANASSTQVLHLSAKKGMLMFSTTRLTARPGRITIEMSNPAGSGSSHGIAVSGRGVHAVGSTVSPGHVASVTVTLKAGKYTFYCPVPGHEQAGMKGTLTVT
jgi:plastocyanin